MSRRSDRRSEGRGSGAGSEDRWREVDRALPLAIDHYVGEGFDHEPGFWDAVESMGMPAALAGREDLRLEATRRGVPVVWVEDRVSDGEGGRDGDVLAPLRALKMAGAEIEARAGAVESTGVGDDALESTGAAGHAPESTRWVDWQARMLAKLLAQENS